jgi:hypothetical protein
LPDPAPLPNDTRQNKEEEAADPTMVGQEEKEGQSGRGQPSAEEHDRARTFKQVLDPYESRLRRQRKNIEQREAAKNTQLRERRGHTIDPFSDLCAGLGNDFAIHQEQEDLSSKCVEEASTSMNSPTKSNLIFRHSLVIHMKMIMAASTPIFEVNV